MPQKYHQRFGVAIGEAETKRRFANRTLNFIFEQLMDIAGARDTYDGREDLAKYICSLLGERYQTVPATERLMGKDFDKCLIVLEGLYQHPLWKVRAEAGIIRLLAEAEIDLGIRWDRGEFWPAGAAALDNALVSDPLNLLVKPEHKGISDAFQKGLDHFLHSMKKPELLADVLTDMYEALEALAKVVANEKDLSGNYEAFVSKIALSEPYKRMLKEYIKYANDFGRHAGPQGKPKPLPQRKEVEAFMYLTGIFIRVALSNN